MFKKLINLMTGLLALAVLSYFLLPVFRQTLRVSKVLGNDTDQWVFNLSYYSRFKAWPQAAWDHLWFEGTPRVLDTSFLHHYLAQPLVSRYGLSLAARAYPLIWLAIYFVFSFLLLARLSKSKLLALLLTATLVYSSASYIQWYDYGVVLSFLAQTVFPAILYFLVLYLETNSIRMLIAASFFLALGFYSHGGLALIFEFVPAIIFLIFGQVNQEKLFSVQKAKLIVFFVILTLSIGALGFFPPLLHAFAGGNYASAVGHGQLANYENVFNDLLKHTNPAVFWAFGPAVLMAILLWRKQRPAKVLIPLLAEFVYFSVYFLALYYQVNPLGDFLFPGRAYWFFGSILCCLSAVLLAPLTSLFTFQKEKILAFLFSNLFKLVIIFAIGLIIFTHPIDLKKDLHLVALGSGFDYQQIFPKLISAVDQTDTNFRVWSHEGGFRLIWNIVSDVPQVEGYYHFWTKYSGDWYSWYLATISSATIDTKTIPQDMADRQGRFLIDWFGVKYLFPRPGSYEFDLAPRFWQENDLILSRNDQLDPPLLVLRPEVTSGIVEAVKVPIIGFVGDDDGYDVFIRAIGTLNLNTHHLIPLRLASSIDKLSSRDLENINLLVLYNFSGKRKSWQKITDFVKKGGKLFIETGGKTDWRQGEEMPEIFPAEVLSFGSLGQEWLVEAKEELTSIDFTKISPLTFENEPWKASYIPEGTELREGSTTLLTLKERPVIVERQIKQGKVLWSGLNNWYRPWKYKENGLNDALILDILLKRLLATPYQTPIEATVTRPKAEKIIVEGVGFSGVVFKEKNLPGWGAKLTSGAKEISLPIYAAGPDFMYVSLPQDLWNQPVKVTLTYQGPWIYWLFLAVTIFSLIFISEELVSNGLVVKRLARSNQKLTKKMGSWWEKDEE